MRLIDADALIGALHNYAFLEGDDRSICYNVIQRQPSIETIYGYQFNELAFVAYILAKEGVAPSELTRTIWDAQRIAEILCKEIKDNIQKAMNGYMEGVEDGKD